MDQAPMTIDEKLEQILRDTPGATIVPPGVDISCKECGMLACVCDLKAKHAEDCPFLRAAICPVAIECEHGYDVCPKCDPCTCGRKGDEL